MRAEARDELVKLGLVANDRLLAELEEVAKAQRSVGLMSVSLFYLVMQLPDLLFGTDKLPRLIMIIVGGGVLLPIMLTVFKRGHQQQRVLAFTLAERDDLRVMAGLVEIVTFRSTPVWDAEEMRAASELMRLLGIHFAAPQQGTFTHEFYKLVRTKLSTLYPSPKRFGLQPRASRTDLTDEQADLIVTFIRLLAESEIEDDRMLLLRIATQPAITPNRQLVKEAAQAFITPAPSLTIAPYYTPLTNATPPAPLTLHRP